MEKRGQVSIFIILGIVIVGIIGAGVYVGTREESVVLESPIQVDPVRKHVEECLDLVSLRGLELIGLQGGYTDINNKDVLSYLNNKMNVVYWLDESSLKAPKFSLIEKNLENFIEEDMKECVTFELFEDFSIEEGEIEVDVSFEDEVEVELEWVLNIKKENQEYEIKDFFGNYDVDMKKIYKLAYGIAETEKTYHFLEDKTLFLIDAYSGVELGKLPPLAEYDFSCSEVKWPLVSVENRLKDVLIDNIPYFKIEGTVFERKEGLVYDNFLLDIFREDFEDVRVDFRYMEEFPLFLNIEPSKGGLIGPIKNNFDVVLGMFCMNKYYFKYDVAYPVLVEIKDDNALNGEGYDFKVPLMVVVKGNNARYRNYVDIEIEESDSFFCDEEQKVSEVEIGAIDGKDKGRISADVYYSCIDEDCFVGDLDIDGGKIGLPACKGGVLNLEKEGYFSKSKRFDSVEGKSLDIGDLELEPFRNLKVKVRKIEINNDKLGSLINLGSNENVFISLEREEDDVGGRKYSTAVNIPGLDEVRLVPGTYNVKAILVYDGEVVIPKEKKCSSRIAGVCVKEYELPEVKMDSLMIGGSEFKWKLGEEIDWGELEFYVLSEGIPRNHDDLMRLFEDIDKHNGLFRDDVIPQII